MRACIWLKRGRAVLMMKPSASSRVGMMTTSTTASRAFIRSAMIIAKTNMSGSADHEGAGS